VTEADEAGILVKVLRGGKLEFEHKNIKAGFINVTLVQSRPPPGLLALASFLAV